MTEQLCPVCGYTIEGEGYEKDGVKYCCESCATDSGPCDCGCCHPVEEEKEEHQTKSTKYSFVVEEQRGLCLTA